MKSHLQSSGCDFACGMFFPAFYQCEPGLSASNWRFNGPRSAKILVMEICLLPPIAPYSTGVDSVHEFHWMSVAEIEKNPAQEPDLSNPSLFCKS